MTPEQRTIIAYGIVNPDEWYSNLLSTVGEEKAEIAVLQKVARYQEQYEEAIATGNYLTRAEREAAKLNSPEYLAEQQKITDHRAIQQAKAQAIIDNLPSWSVVGGKFDTMLADATAATNLAQAKAVLIELIKTQKKMARVLYWEVKNTEE